MIQKGLIITIISESNRTNVPAPLSPININLMEGEFIINVPDQPINLILNKVII